MKTSLNVTLIKVCKSANARITRLPWCHASLGMVQFEPWYNSKIGQSTRQQLHTTWNKLLPLCVITNIHFALRWKCPVCVFQIFHLVIKGRIIISIQALQEIKAAKNDPWKNEGQAAHTKPDQYALLPHSCHIVQVLDMALKRLDPIHNHGLRLVTGAYRTWPVQSLYAESNEPCRFAYTQRHTAQGFRCLWSFIFDLGIFSLLVIKCTMVVSFQALQAMKATKEWPERWGQAPQ